MRIEHTVFALPFAYVGAFLAAGDWPGLGDMLWITVAMVGARTVAMALNRLVDAELDARNPRTASRELPSGALTRSQVLALTVGALGVFLVAVFQLDPVVRWLWPIPVAMFFVYPYLKRFTWLSHVWLGACLGLAPIGAFAVSGSAPWEAWAIGGAVLLWVAGFDLFYSLFDVEHDHRGGLHSWAVRFGVRGVFLGRGRFISERWRCSPLRVPASTSASWYWLGVLVVAALLAYEHAIVRPDDLRRLDAAFFTVNGIISVVFFVFVALDVVA